MTYFYTPNQKSGYKGIIIIFCFLFLITEVLSAQETLSAAIESECINCFSSEIIEISEDGNCLNINLIVFTTEACIHTLSHLVVEIPCGIPDEITISENWTIEKYLTDPTTGLTGFKVDQINTFGSKEVPDTFYISYRVCSPDPLCLSELKSGFTIAYKAGNCVFTEEISNTTTSSIDLKLFSRDVSCFGGNDGAVYSVITGEEEPFSYQWSNGSTGTELLNVSAGSYTLVLTDAAGNSVKKTAVVGQPELPLNIGAEIINASCKLYDGGINISVSGGTEPYSFRWNTGDTAQHLSNAGQGTYNFMVIDAMGCSVSKNFSIVEDTDLELSLTPNYLECYQEGQGEIQSTVNGGTEPYTYSWSNGETSANISGVNSGLYNLTVTDSEGCSKTKSAYIGLRDLSISASIQHPTCYGEDEWIFVIVIVGKLECTAVDS